MLVLFPSKNTKNSFVAMAMQRFFEFFRRKNYGALWNNLFNSFTYPESIRDASNLARVKKK